MTVTDDGPGIPAEQIAAALARGSRLDTMSGGSGLGLAIVSDVAEAWGGSIAFNSRANGFSAIFGVAAAPPTSG